MKKLQIALLCGGPSLERGVSLNSARSVCDHLQSANVEVTPIYFDYQKKAYKISRDQLYSNTPSDFDFKLSQTATALTTASLTRLLKQVDLAFPVIHGSFGEDGEIQAFLEKIGVPYIGSDKPACYNCFDKYRANELIREKGFFALPSALLKIHKDDENAKIISEFFRIQKLKRAIVKPATGGSSIGVHSVSTPEEAFAAAKNIFGKRIDTRVVLEPFCEGTEFTVIILQNRFGMPVALFPTEIEVDYREHQIFDYRKKYLATNQRTYHCPPRFADAVTEKIQVQAEQLFQLLGMRDFARFDGWLLKNGEIWFSDFNPVSGMEQNSFLFLQAAQIGFTHRDLLLHILQGACARHNLQLPQSNTKVTKKTDINVIFGGKTAERQVSIMSGTNAWLKLLKSEKYAPHPYLLDLDEKTVWRLPYDKTLNHTVEEIRHSCLEAEKAEKWISPLRERVLLKLSLPPAQTNFLPEKLPLDEFIAQSPFVFIGLHGGIGENGTLQKLLEKAHKPFNGSGSQASQLCMDKYRTGTALSHLAAEGIHISPKILLSVKELSANPQESWQKILQTLNTNSIIVKPPTDGCSAGIVKLNSAAELEIYLQAISKGLAQLPANSLKNQEIAIEMPTEKPENLMFEQFIKTDKVRIVQNHLKWEIVSNWIEVTIGVLGTKGQMRALNPSLTVARGDVLSLEEKFQGGTGVNITPPPQPHVRNSAIKAARQRLEKVAQILGLEGYARVDAFMHTQSGELIIIEANTTPALTPSTVLYHQALAENPQIYPTELLETIIAHGYERLRIKN